MNEFNLDNSFDIGTPISKLKNKSPSNNDNLLNLIKDLEDRLDNIETTNTLDSLQINTPTIKKDDKVNSQKKIENNDKFKYSEIIIFIIIFILLNNKFTIETIYKLPYFKNTSSIYTNLILRTCLFGIFVYSYKRFVK